MQGEGHKAQEASGKARPRHMVVRVLCVLALFACALCLGACGDELQRALELQNSGDVEGALAAYTEVLAEDPDDVEALSGSAVCLMLLRRFDEALELQERVVVLDPEDVLTRLELGFNYLNHQERAGDAVRVMSEAAALEPSAKHLTFLAQAQKAAGDADGAEDTLRLAIEADPRYGYSYAQLAALLEDEGRADEARVVRDEAAALGITLTDAQ